MARAGPDALAPARDAAVSRPPLLQAVALSVRYGTAVALAGVDLNIPAQGLTAIIGPSGCGKSTLLRSFNRMNDGVPGMRRSGSVRFAGTDVYAAGVDPAVLRRHIGMVFQRPVVFPMTIFDNVAYGPRLHRLERSVLGLAERVECALRDAGLFAEVKDRLRAAASTLSGGQQQRLAIARALAVGPEVLLLDEPTSVIDPAATAHVEDTLRGLAERLTVVLVTHNLQQAAHISTRVAFLQRGELVECGPTADVFHRPRDRRTEDYLTGRSA